MGSPPEGRQTGALGACAAHLHVCVHSDGFEVSAPGVALRSGAAPGAGLVTPSETSATRGVETEIEVPCAALRVASMRRGVKASARAIEEVALSGSRRCAPWLITLTYREVDSWRARHVSAYLDCLRKWAQRQGFAIPYVWVAELQKRGAVHYHVVAWVPVRLQVPKGDKRGWWPHGMTQRVRARKPVGYLMKYASKGVPPSSNTGGSGGDSAAPEFPRSLRLHGAGGLTAPGRVVRRWLTLPVWLLKYARTFQRVVRLPGGVWLLEETGEVVRSPWEFVRFDASLRSVVFRQRRAPVPDF